MPPNSQAKLLKEVTCPFCSLLCDDLELKSHSGKLTIKRNGCPKAIHWFEFKDPDITTYIHGIKASFDEAIEHAAEILKNARQPIITGLGTDVAGSRAAMQLAETTGAILDHGESAGFISNILTLQTGGWVLTTLAELKNRADMIVFIGTDGISNYPRFFERFIWNQHSLSGLKKNSREIIYIGNKLNTDPGITPDGKKSTIVNCSEEDLCETIAILRTLLKGNEIKSKTIARKRISTLRKISERLKKANYCVFVWAPGEFSIPHAELLVQTICELIKELNQTSRYAGLPLGGNNGSASFVNVCSWQSGYPLRISYTDGYPKYDPHNYSTTEALNKNEADAMLWISSFFSDETPPQTSVPTIVLSRPSKKVALDTEVYFPVGTPGLDHAGNMFRVDNIVNLPLMQTRQTHFVSVSDVLTKIQNAL